MKRTYPSKKLENALRAFEYPVHVLWEMKGPKDTEVAWMQALVVNGAVVIVQTFRDESWRVYTSCNSTDYGDMIKDVIDRTLKR